jgi:hypothetical protein
MMSQPERWASTYSKANRQFDGPTLVNVNVEPVFMAVREVFLPPTNLHSHKRNIYPVLFHKVRAVLTIFAVVPTISGDVKPAVITPERYESTRHEYRAALGSWADR